MAFLPPCPSRDTSGGHYKTKLGHHERNGCHMYYVGALSCVWDLYEVSGSDPLVLLGYLPDFGWSYLTSYYFDFHDFDFRRGPLYFLYFFLLFLVLW